MRMKHTLAILALFAPALGVSYSFAFETGAPPGYTGALGQPTCAAAGCHDSYPVNSGPGQLYVWQLSYLPDSPTVLDIRLVGAPGTRWGFQATERTPHHIYDMQARWLDSVRTQLTMAADTPYFSHTLAGTGIASSDSQPNWLVSYVVGNPNPPTDVWCPYVFVAAVAGDGDGTPSGDYVYSRIADIEPANCGCRWEMTGDLNHNSYLSSGDLILLVGVVFKGAPLPDPCILADLQCDGTINASDLVYMVNWLFKGGRPPCDGCDFTALLFDHRICH
jgi:hypothetical protein